jgi:hypothetical protein
MYYRTREDEMTVQSVSVHRDVLLKEGKALVSLAERFEEEEIEKIWEKELLLETIKVIKRRASVQRVRNEQRLSKKKIPEPPEVCV